MSELADDHDRREYESQMKSEARPNDAKTVLEIRRELIHAAGEHPCCSDTFNAAERALERAEARVDGVMLAIVETRDCSSARWVREAVNTALAAAPRAPLDAPRAASPRQGLEGGSR
jgi:hypothetical protein